MKEKVSVEKAIKRGQLIVNLPVFITRMMILGLGLYLEIINFLKNSDLKYIIILAVIIPWLIWSFRITKWRIWAYENVENINELKKSGVNNMLIWPEGHFLRKQKLDQKSKN